MPRRPLDPVCPGPIPVVDDGSIDQKLVILENKLVPKNLGSIPVAEEPLEEDAYLYVDNGGQPSKIKASDIGGAQIQSDWAQTDSTKVDFIKNKPSIPAGQIQVDWNQTDSSKLDYIKNKPFQDKVTWEALADSLQARIVSDETRLTTLEGEYNEIEARVDQQDIVIDEIQDDIAHINDDIAHLEADKQNKLIPGENITIEETSEGPVISAQMEVGTISYHDLADKPTINQILLDGNMHLKIDGGLIVPTETV